MKRPLLLSCLVAVLCSVIARGAPAFRHPGLLQDADDLARIRQAVAARQEPIYGAYQKFRASPASQYDYRMRGPAPEIGRSPSVAFPEYDSDANAAYQCALMWCITGDPRYADKAKQIINAWSATLRRVSGADAVLMAGLGPFKMVNAAELLRWTNSGWSEEDARRAEHMFREAIYPTLQDFAPFANGNWDTAAIKTMAAIAVFCDDRPMFERALRYYVDGAGDGRLTHYIINDSGQCQESGRDMAHTQLGLAHLGDTCEIAWHQGLDLYGYEENRLLAGFEYTARYNLGETVPFVETLDRTGKYHHTKISTAGRGNLRAVYEEIYNHYVNRRGLPAPWTARAAARLRPEGAGTPGADHPGFGTLLYSRTAAEGRAETAGSSAAPAAVIAHGSPGSVTLTWVPPIGATHYTIGRATCSTGTNAAPTWSVYEAIASNLPSTGGPGSVPGTPSYVDHDVAPGALYRYVVRATTTQGTAESCPATVSAGLPPPWQPASLGPMPPGTDVQFDGTTLTLEAGGLGIAGTNDSALFPHAARDGDTAITARYVPQISSQRTQLGVMLRGSLAPDAPETAVLLVPDLSEEAERPHWTVELVVRERAGAATKVAASLTRLAAPYVTYGRLVAPFWVRLERAGDVVTALASGDGSQWTTVGTANLTLPPHVLAGVVASSGVPALTTTVTFDHVAIR